MVVAARSADAIPSTLALAQEAAYESLLKRTRQQLHGRAETSAS